MEYRKFHFIYLYGSNTREFDINHRISVASNIEVNKPLSVYIYTNDVFRLADSPHMKVLLDTYDEIRIIDIDPIFDKIQQLIDIDLHTLPYMAHVADMCRLYIMYTQGGVYSDVDSVAIKPLPNEVWSSDKPIFCFEYPDETGYHAICNGFFYSPKGNKFLYDWLMNYLTYNPTECKPGTPSWTKYSVQLAWAMYKANPDRIKVYDSEYLEPFTLLYKDTQDMYFLTNFEKLINSYQMHLWETRNRDILKVLDENYFKYSQATYAQIGKAYL